VSGGVDTFPASCRFFHVSSFSSVVFPALGVGHIFAYPANVVPPVCPSVGFSFVCAPLLTVIVGNNPDSISSVRGIDGASRNNKRPAGVAFAFQVRKHLVEAHADVTINIFSNDPTGPGGSHEPMHFRPEVTVIFLASALPGLTKWLAWVSPADDVNRSDCISF
jgi:hypothetical protein